MFREVPLADAGLAIEPMQRSFRRNSDKVSVTLFVLRKHQQVIVFIALTWRAVVLFFGDIKLATKNWLDAFCLGRVEEVDRAIDIPVVRHRDRLLPQRRYPVHEFVDVASPIEQRVFRMQMQMRKLRHG